MILSKFPGISSQISWSVLGMSEMKQYTYSQKGKSIQKLCETKTLHFLFLWSIFRLSQRSQVKFRYTSKGEAQLKPSQVLMYLQR